MEKLKWSARYFADITKWIVRTRPLMAIFLALIVVSLLCILIATGAEPRIRLTGMVLQLAGVFLVGVGLWDTRRAFADEPTTWQAIGNWWSRRPVFGPKNVVVAGVGISLGAAVVSGRARGSPGPNTSLDQRVSMLEDQYSHLFDEVGSLASETKTRIQEVENSLKAESSERKRADENTREQLRQAVAAGLPLARVGVLFFVVGILAGTASPELAKLF